MRELEFEKQLTDDEVMLLLQRSIRDDRETTAQMLVHLGEVDARGLFRGEGYNSMFEYAVQALHMSEAEASLRIRAARFVRKFPRALDMVANGELHLTAICLLAPVMTDQSIELLNLARHKSKGELHKLIAKHFPRPDVRSEVRKLPTHQAPARGDTSAVTASWTDPVLPFATREDASTTSATATSHAKPTLLFAARENASTTNATVAVRADPLLQSVATDDVQHAPRTTPPAELSLDAVDLYGVSQDTRQQPRAVLRSDDWSRTNDDHSHHTPTPTRAAVPASRATGVQMPLSETRYKIQFTASAALNRKLNDAKALLRREVPTGDLAAVFELALDLLIADRKKKMFGLTARPRTKPRAGGSDESYEAPIANTAPQATPATQTRSCDERSSQQQARSRHLPRELQRQVYVRDEGQCRFVGPNGNRCSAKEYLEFHHVVPFARGGGSYVANVELRCRTHNVFEAERDYGRTVMKQRVQQRRAQQLCSEQAAFTQPTKQPADRESSTTHCAPVTGELLS